MTNRDIFDDHAAALSQLAFAEASGTAIGPPEPVPSLAASSLRPQPSEWSCHPSSAPSCR